MIWIAQLWIYNQDDDVNDAFVISGVTDQSIF